MFLPMTLSAALNMIYVSEGTGRGWFPSGHDRSTRGAPMRHGSKTMMTMRRLRSGFSRLVLTALVAVTVMGGTLAIGTGTTSARTFGEWCAFQQEGVDQYLTWAGEELSE